MIIDKTGNQLTVVFDNNVELAGYIANLSEMLAKRLAGHQAHLSKGFVFTENDKSIPASITFHVEPE